MTLPLWAGALFLKLERNPMFKLRGFLKSEMPARFVTML